MTKIVSVPPAARPHQGHRAGVVSRLMADGLDLGVVVALLAGAYLAFAATLFIVRPSSFTFPSPSLLASVWILLAVAAGYLTFCWAVNGRSVGKHVMGLRVVRERDGRPLGGREGRLGAARSLLRAAACVVLPVGLFWAAVSAHNRSVQDILLGTCVIHDWTSRADAPGEAG
jgi:uncharacterized RDD family membrane protein YckC